MLKRLIQTPFKAISPIVPGVVSRFIYLIPFYLLKIILDSKIKGTHLWYRHSVYYNDIVFAVSDLDLTYFSKKKLDRLHVKRVERLISLVKIFFPFIGEVNYYDEDYLKSFSPFFNSLEIGRDPELLRFIEDLESRKVHRQVFALNWLSSDSHKMIADFSSRKKKIKRFSDLLGLKKTEYTNMQELIESLSAEVFSKGKEDWTGFLKEFAFHDTNSSEGINEFYRDNPQFRKIFQMAYPQKWIGASLHFGDFEEDHQLSANLDDEERELFLAQIDWEIIGLSAQLFREDDISNLYIHCENLINAIRPIGSQGSSHISALKSLSNIQEAAIHGEEQYV